MAETISDKLDRFVLEVAKICKIEEVYLFGSSAATGDMERSDLDLAIVSELFNADNHFYYMTQFILLSGKYGLNIEPHLFDKSETFDDFFKNEVISKGIRLLPAAA